MIKKAFDANGIKFAFPTVHGGRRRVGRRGRGGAEGDSSWPARPQAGRLDCGARATMPWELRRPRPAPRHAGGAPRRSVAARAAAHATGEPPAKVQTFVDLLDDPAVRDWLQAQLDEPAADAGIRRGRMPGGPSDGGIGAADARALAPASGADRRRACRGCRRRWRRPAAARWPRSRLGLLGPAPLVAGFVGAGLVAEWLFLRGTRRLRRGVLGAPRRRSAAVCARSALRLLLALVSVVMFAAASLGAFLLFDWPPLFRAVVRPLPVRLPPAAGWASSSPACCCSRPCRSCASCRSDTDDATSGTALGGLPRGVRLRLGLRQVAPRPGRARRDV